MEATSLESTKTRIMLMSNLSFSLLEKYLAVSINAGFVRAEGSTYLMTRRGRDFLDPYINFEARYIRAQKLLDALICERERLTRLCGGN